MDKKDKPTERYMRPLKMGARPSTHVLIWTEPHRDCTIGQRRMEVRSYRVTTNDITAIDTWAPLSSPEQLRDYLLSQSQRKRVLYAWLPGGWEDMIVSGLTHLLDSGQMEYGYLSTSPDKTILRGRIKGRSIHVGSVGGWTGAGWDGWREHTEARERELYVESWQAIAALSLALQLPKIAPSAISASRMVWRGILGPRTTVYTRVPKKKDEDKSQYGMAVVLPLRRRAQWVRQLERHSCYGMVTQYAWQGYYPSKIYVVDIPQAYLSAYATAPMPVAYDRRVKHTTPLELEGWLQNRWGMALVHVHTEEYGYPLRRHGRVCLASGQYWTWLCGEELMAALRGGHVCEVQEALLYYSIRHPEQTMQAMLAIRQHLDQRLGKMAVAAWRSVYCQLVGSWAHWRREWKPVDRRSPVGNWGVWHAAEGVAGVIRHYRAVAGRVEKMYISDGSWYAYPPIYAAVLSQLRTLVGGVLLAAEGKGILGIENDSVWLTEDGFAHCQRTLAQYDVEPEKCRAKVVYDRAWILDRHRAVVEREGKRYLRRPGVPATLPLDEHGAVQWRTHLGMMEHTPEALAGTMRGRTRRVVLNTKIPESEDQGKPLPLWEHLVDPVLDQELMEPFLPRTITIEDI
jgi:hypothetical protein